MSDHLEYLEHLQRTLPPELAEIVRRYRSAREDLEKACCELNINLHATEAWGDMARNEGDRHLAADFYADAYDAASDCSDVLMAVALGTSLEGNTPAADADKERISKKWDSALGIEPRTRKLALVMAKP